MSALPHERDEPIPPTPTEASEPTALEPTKAASFRKKPVVIQAIQWTGSNVSDVLDFGNTGPCPLWGDDFCIKKERVFILTPEGTVSARIGDWIIRGVKGEFYPCKPDIFEATYEPEEATAPTATPDKTPLAAAWDQAGKVQREAAERRAAEVREQSSDKTPGQVAFEAFTARDNQDDITAWDDWPSRICEDWEAAAQAVTEQLRTELAAAQQNYSNVEMHWLHERTQKEYYASQLHAAQHHIADWKHVSKCQTPNDLAAALAAAMQATAEAERERDEMRQYRERIEHALGRGSYATQKILEHFNGDGTLKGDGKWRAREIWNSCKAFDECLNVLSHLECGKATTEAQQLREAITAAQQRAEAAEQCVATISSILKPYPGVTLVDTAKDYVERNRIGGQIQKRCQELAADNADLVAALERLTERLKQDANRLELECDDPPSQSQQLRLDAINAAIQAARATLARVPQQQENNE